MSSNYHLFTSLCLKGIVISSFALSPNSFAGDIRVNLEAPGDGLPYQGIANIRGWAVSTAGIDRIELYINGKYKADIPFGGKRQDVGNNFPQYPDSSESGFSMVYNYSVLATKQHQFSVKAIDNDGSEKEVSVSISTTSFDKPYIQDPDAFDLSQAQISAKNNTIDIKNMRLDGKAYNAKLTWRAESQLYQFNSITPR